MAKLKNKISLETPYNYLLKKHHHNFEFMIYGKKFVNLHLFSFLGF